MSYRIFKVRNSPFWYADFGTHQGKRIRESTGATAKKDADEWAQHHAADLHRQERFGESPQVTWDTAVIAWLAERTEGRREDAIENDKQRLRFFSTAFSQRKVADITANEIQTQSLKLRNVGAATRNRYMTSAIAILNFAFDKEWRPAAAKKKAFKEPASSKRVRYLTPEEAKRLLAELPDFLRAMAEFTLATGLRAANVRLLEWARVDITRCIAWVLGPDTKNRKNLGVPLNAAALSVLRAQYGKHWKWVFPYRDRPIVKCSTKSWYSACRRAGIENFHWHDLRHTWASWHIASGTRTRELQDMGGWSSAAMVERYAHLEVDHMVKAAGNIDAMWQTSGKLEKLSTAAASSNSLNSLERETRLELATPTLAREYTVSDINHVPSKIIDLCEVVLAKDAEKATENSTILPGSAEEVAKKWQTKT